jgi:histidinol-phosphatase (PHP family)
MLTSYHNHTRHSDAVGTVRETVAAAQSERIDEVGISDHLALHPGGVQLKWSMAEEHLPDYAADVLRFKDSLKPRVRLGLEADYFPGTVERLRSLLARHPFDYVLGSVHYADDFQIDQGAKPWKSLTAEGRRARWEVYWLRVAEMAKSGVFDIASHLDLPKRFGYRDAEDAPQGALAALDALAAADMALEINASGWFHLIEEPYPSPALLREACKRGIPVLVSADSHRPEHVARGLERGRALAREAGYTEVVRFESRRRFPIPL